MARKRKRSRGGSGSGVSRRSLLLLAGTGALGVTGAYSSGAFDSVSGDRAFGVGTSGDDTALLGIDIEEREGVDGETITLLEADEPVRRTDQLDRRRDRQCCRRAG